MGDNKINPRVPAGTARLLSDTIQKSPLYTERVSKFGISSCAKIPADQRSQTTQY